MENISCMRFKYLCEFLTGIEETYTDKNDKSFRISQSAGNKLSTLWLCKIDSAKTVRATYDPFSNAVDLTVSGYVYDSVLEDMKEIFETVFMKAHDVSPPKRTANNMALNSSQTELGALFLPNRQKSMKNTEMLENLTSRFRERRSNVKR